MTGKGRTTQSEPRAASRTLPADNRAKISPIQGKAAHFMAFALQHGAQADNAHIAADYGKFHITFPLHIAFRSMICDFLPAVRKAGTECAGGWSGGQKAAARRQRLRAACVLYFPSVGRGGPSSRLFKEFRKVSVQDPAVFFLREVEAEKPYQFGFRRPHGEIRTEQGPVYPKVGDT